MEKQIILIYPQGGCNIYKRYILIMSVLMITLLAMVTSGCSSLTGPSGTATPTTQGVTLAPTAKPSVAAQPTGVATSAEGTTISASVNQNVPVRMEKGAYLIKVKSQGNIAVESVSPSGSASTIASIYGTGSAERSSIVQQIATEDDTYRITDVSAPYTIQILKLPLANPVSTPQIYTGVGPQAMGPIMLNKGTAKFNIKCPDTAAGSDIQLFSVHLKDGKTGDELGEIANNIDRSVIPIRPITNYNVDKTFEIPATGVYFVEVSVASPKASWQITVTQ